MLTTRKKNSLDGWGKKLTASAMRNTSNANFSNKKILRKKKILSEKCFNHDNICEEQVELEILYDNIEDIGGNAAQAGKKIQVISYYQ